MTGLQIFAIYLKFVNRIIDELLLRYGGIPLHISLRVIYWFSANTAFSRFKVSILKIKMRHKDNKILKYDKRQKPVYLEICFITSFDGVGAVLAAAAAGAVLAAPYAVELL